MWFGVWGCASHELRFASRLGWALDGGWVGVVGCRFEFRRIYFGGNVWGIFEVVGGVRIVWTVGDFGIRGEGGSRYGTIYLNCIRAHTHYAHACTRTPGKTFEVVPFLFYGVFGMMRQCLGSQPYMCSEVGCRVSVPVT